MFSLQPTAPHSDSTRLDAEVAIRRRQIDPQLRTVAEAKRNGEECQQQLCRLK